MTHWRDLYPFASHWLELSSGQRLHYVDEGAGSPVLMVHGNPTWSFYWRRLILDLRERFRMIAVDHLGCGLSDKPLDYDYCLTRHIENLVALIERLDLQDVTLVVHDWGGAIGLGAAVESEIQPRIARLAILNTAAFPPPYVPLRIRLCHTPLLGTFAIRQWNLFARAALTMATEKPERFTEAVCEGFLAPYDSWEHRVAIDAFVQDIPLTKAHPSHARLAELERRLPELADRPARLLWGLKDWCFTEECLRRFEQLLPNAETHEFPDAGHYVMEDASERIIPLIDQLAGGKP